MKHLLEGNIKTREIKLDGGKLTPYLAQKLYGHNIVFDWGQKSHGSFVLAVAISLRLNGTHDGCYKLRNSVILNLPRTLKFQYEFEWEFPNENTRKLIFQYIRGYNKYLTNEYLMSKNNMELLCFVHPLERESFERGLIN